MFKSSIAKKSVMAITGVALLGFVCGHLAGNLLVFAGQNAINTYAKGLQNLGAFLWVIRIGLLAFFVVHIVTGIQLKRMNAVARPVSYSYNNTVQASFASLTMLETGIIILAFVALHLAHFTFRVIDPSYASLHDSLGRHDVYSMIIAGFSQLPYVGIYIFCMLVLGLHLSHGISSFFQTMGWNSAKYMPGIRRVGPCIAWTLALGYISIPLAVVFGIIPPVS